MADSNNFFPAHFLEASLISTVRLIHPFPIGLPYAGFLLLARKCLATPFPRIRRSASSETAVGPKGGADRPARRGEVCAE
jgi:hypothetical protein